MRPAGIQAIIVLVVALLATTQSAAATLESPAHGATLSGLGFIAGWKCSAGNITVRINEGGHIPVATGQPRADTRIACGTINNGFITQMNWALLGDGEHTIVAYDDGVRFASATFTVVTAGEEFLPDAAGECVVPNFPAPGENSSFAWNTSTQHLELVDVGSHVVAPHPAATGLERFVGLWETTYRSTFEGCTHNPPWTTTWPFTVNTATEFDTSTGLSIVLPSGYIEGSFPTEPEGERTFSISGRFTDTTGAGTWFNNFGCGGEWMARKLSDDPNAVPPEPEPEPIHGQCGSTRNTCRAGMPNDSAVADTDTHYRWICTGQQGGMSSGTCQVAKPAQADPALRAVLGRWRFAFESGWQDEWTITTIQGNTASGRTTTGYPVTVRKAPGTGYDYQAQWVEPPPPSPISPPPGYTPPPDPDICVKHLFTLEAPAVARGVGLIGRRPQGSGCQQWRTQGDTIGGRLGPAN